MCDYCFLSLTVREQRRGLCDIYLWFCRLWSAWQYLYYMQDTHTNVYIVLYMYILLYWLRFNRNN